MSDAIAVAPASLKRSFKPTGPRVGQHRYSALTQIMDLQAIAFESAHDPKVPAHIKAALMRAWVDLEDIRMAKQGIGRPKPVEARNATTKRKPRAPIAPISAIEQAQARDASRPPATPSIESF